MTALAAVWVFSAGQSAHAAETANTASRPDENPHRWEPKVTSVSVFKNGYAFLVREGRVDLRDGWCAAGAVPPAAFGTLAIYAHDQDATVDIVGSGPGEVTAFDGHDAPEDVEAIRARLAGCMDLDIELTYIFQGVERTAAGKLVSLSPEYAVLETEVGNAATPLAAIKKMQILGLPLRVHVSNANGDSATGDSTLGMAYLREGLTWLPEYTLRIIDETTAELTLRGTLINEAEDLIHCDVNFVVGVPNFQHSNYLAPIAMGQTIRRIGSALAPTPIMSQVMNRAALVGNGNDIRSPQFENFGVVQEQVPTGAGALRNVMGNLPEMDSIGATDYTVYTKKDLTVRRGEQAIVTLFTRKIQFSHLYRWKVPGKIRHELTLRNDTGTAWTTGPCLAISGNQPLSEALLTYTPRGGDGILEVTDAVNIASDRTETEKDRQMKAHSPAHDVHYDLVHLTGEVKLRNFEKRPVELVIEMPVEGLPKQASDDGEIWIDTSELRLLNRRGSIRWRITLKAEEERTLAYAYDRYVPSR